MREGVSIKMFFAFCPHENVKQKENGKIIKAISANNNIKRLQRAIMIEYKKKVKKNSSIIDAKKYESQSNFFLYIKNIGFI